MSDTNIEQRLSVIETDIKHLTKSIDRLIAYMPKLNAIEADVETLKNKMKATELHNSKLRIFFYSTLTVGIFTLLSKGLF